MNPENNFNANENSNQALNNDLNQVNNQPNNQEVPVQTTDVTQTVSNVAPVTEVAQPTTNVVPTPTPMQPTNNLEVQTPVTEVSQPVNDTGVQTPVNNVTPTPTPVQPVNNMGTQTPVNNVVMPNNMNGQVIQQQPYYGVPAQPEKSNKTLFIILGVVVAVIVLIAVVVGGIFLFKVKGSKANFSKPDSVAKAYVIALTKKDYKEAKKYVYIPEGGFVSDNDYLDFITRKEYAKVVVDRSVDTVTENRKASEEAEYTIATKDGDEAVYNVTVPLILKEGKWYINEANLYVKDWKLSVPGGTKVTIGGEEVDKKFITTKEGTYEVYVLPAIAKESKKIKLKNDLGELEKDMTPTSDGNTVKIEMELKNDELVNKAREYVKNTWNSISTAAEANKDLSEIRKYFDDSIDTDTINIYYKNMATMFKGSSGYKNINLKMTSIIARPETINYISANDVISLNFGYTLNWTWNFSMGGPRDMHRYSSIRLKTDGDSFKIYQVTDEKLFSWLNNFTHDFKE